MSYVDILHKRRSRYEIGRDLPINDQDFQNLVKQAIYWTPDAFNMRSTRAVIVQGETHEKLWDLVVEVYDGKVKPEKVAGFKAAYATVIFFVDQDVIDQAARKFPIYAASFTTWANQSSGMAQVNVWNALAEQNIGANLQHYNPVINQAVRELLGIPESWMLEAQMVVGSIIATPDPKDRGDIDERVWVR